MTAALFCQNLLTWSLQIAILVAAGGLLCLALRFGPPRARLHFWHVLLVASLLLPVLPVRRIVQVMPSRKVASMSVDISGLAGGSPVPQHLVSRTILALLVAGGLFRLGWLGLACLELRRFRRRARPLSQIPDSIREAVASFATAGDFYFSDDVTGPVTFGFRHQTVLLPPAFFSLNSAAQHAVITHELLHLRRNDWAFVVAEEFIRATFWFHPAIWWLLSQIQLTREQTVDRAAIDHLGDRDRYIDALLAVALSQVRADLAPAPLFLRKRQLARRVALLVEGTKMSKQRFITSLAAMTAVLTAIAAIAIWQLPLVAATQKDAGGPPLHIVKQIAPKYPPDAKAAHLEGSVVLSLQIDEQGKVEKAEVLSGPEQLRQASLDAVRQWEFQPKMLDGKPVAVTSDVTINFKLDKPPQKGAGLVPPELVTKVKPAYPAEAKAAKIQGAVILKVSIGETGRVEKVEPIAGPDMLRQPAIDAVKQWVFQPATADGEPVATQTDITINFTLDQSAEEPAK